MRQRPTATHRPLDAATVVCLWRGQQAADSGSKLSAEDVGTRGSALAMWHEHNPAPLFSPSEATTNSLAEAEQDIAAWRESKLGFLTFLDQEYAAQLREIHEIPPVLFHQGSLVPGEIGMSVVGSRQASARGLDLARATAQGLVDRDITVISGRAEGIDTAAHTRALDARGRTVANHRHGHPQVLSAGGPGPAVLRRRHGPRAVAVLAEYPPSKHGFPMHNTVMSG